MLAKQVMEAPDSLYPTKEIVFFFGFSEAGALVWRESMRDGRKKWKRLLPVICAGVLVVSSGSLHDGMAEAAVKKPVLNKKTVTLTVGKSTALKVKKGTDKIKKVIWSSNKKTVATVNKNGKVTAKKAGNAKITAKVKTVKKTYRLTCKVTCKAKTASENIELPFTMQDFEKANSAENLLGKYSGFSYTTKIFAKTDEFNQEFPGGYLETGFLSRDVISCETPTESTLYQDDRKLVVTSESASCVCYMDTKKFKADMDEVLKHYRYDQSEENMKKASRSGDQITFTTETANRAYVKQIYEDYGLDYQENDMLYGIYTVDADTLEVIRSVMSTKEDGSFVLKEDSYQYGTSFETEKTVFQDVLAAKKRNLILTYAAGTADEITKKFQMEKNVGFLVDCPGGLVGGESFFQDAACEKEYPESTGESDYSDIRIYIPQLREADALDQVKFQELVKANTCEEVLKRHSAVQAKISDIDGDGRLSGYFWHFDQDSFVYDSDDYTKYVNREHYLDRYKIEENSVEFLLEDDARRQTELDYSRNLYSITIPEQETLMYTKTAGGTVFYYTEIKDETVVRTFLEEKGSDGIPEYESGMFLSYCYLFDAKNNDLKEINVVLCSGDGKKQYYFADYMYDYDKGFDIASTSLKDYFSQTEKRKVTVTFYADDAAHKKTVVFEVPKGIGVEVMENKDLLKGTVVLYTDEGFTQRYRMEKDNKTDDLVLYARSEAGA